LVSRSRRGNVVPLVNQWHVIHEVDVVRLIADHLRLAALCDLLERCADDLPTWPSPATTAYLRKALATLAQPGGDDRPPYPTLAELIDIGTRHATDVTHAQDLADALDAAPDGEQRVSPDTLGYMLRCFFNGCRQAMDCEELAILALARHRLTRTAREALLDSLRFRAARRSVPLSP